MSSEVAARGEQPEPSLSAGKLLGEFSNILIANKVIAAPFWMNNDPDLRGTKWFFSVPKGGKLSPREIAERVIDVANTHQLDLLNLRVDELRVFMKDQGIGVDCSGLTYQISESIFNALGGSVFRDVVFDVNNGHGGITRVNSDCLTSSPNAFQVDDVLCCRPGDLIRCHGGKHSISILSVDLSINGLKLKCAHSSDGIPASGVSVFEIEIIDSSKDIFEQNWSEVSTSGVPFNEKLLDKHRDGDGVWRLRAIHNLYSRFNRKLGT